MSAAVDVSNSELRHLNSPINFCIVAEDVTIQSQIWGVENLDTKQKYDYQSKPRRSNVEHFDILNNNWEISQPQEFYDQIDVYTSDLPQYLDSNLERLILKFNLAIKKSTNKALPIELIREHFYKTANKIAELDCTDATVEIASSNTLKYTLIFPESKMLMISSTIGNNNEEVVFSFFINRELISTNAMELTGFIEGFKKFLKD